MNMGGRGYHNDVQGYLRSDARTSSYIKINELSNERIDFIQDDVKPAAPVTPEFSNSANKIYVLLDKSGTKIKNITVYDDNHEQKYSIHLDHPHKNQTIHVHSGMNSGRKDIPLSSEHRKLIEEVYKIFNKRRK